MSWVENTTARAMVLFESGDYKQAADLFEHVLPYIKADSAIWAWFSFCLLRRGRLPQAIEAAQRVVAHSDPRVRGLAYSVIGRSSWHLNDDEAAETALRQAVEQFPNPYDWHHLFELYFLLDRTAEAIASLQAALELDPTFDGAHYELGRQYMSQRDWESAERAFTRATELQPEWSEAHSELASAIWSKARASVRLHGHDSGYAIKATRLVIKAIRIDPTNVWARIQYANILEAMNKFKWAEKQYLVAIELWPDVSMPHWMYGGFLSNYEINPGLAEWHLAEAIRLNPQDGIADYRMGKHCLRSQRREEAKEFLTRAVELGDKRSAELLQGI